MGLYAKIGIVIKYNNAFKNFSDDLINNNTND
jgi:hypothetical protein